MTERLPVPSSRAFDLVAGGSPFRDLIVRPVHATPDAIFRAFRPVTLREMPLASALGSLRYLPARLIGRQPASAPTRPFVDLLVEGGTLVLLDDAPREIITRPPAVPPGRPPRRACQSLSRRAASPYTDRTSCITSTSS